jgi:hypothetical protein
MKALFALALLFCCSLGATNVIVTHTNGTQTTYADTFAGLQSAIQASASGDLIQCNHGTTYSAPLNAQIVLPYFTGNQQVTIYPDDYQAIPPTGTRIATNSTIVCKIVAAGVTSNPPGFSIPVIAANAAGATIPQVPGAHDFRFYGIKVTVAAGGSANTNAYLITISPSTPTVNSIPTTQTGAPIQAMPQRIVFDHVILTGNAGDPGPCRDIQMNGTGLVVVDSVLDEAKINALDCQAVQGTMCIGCSVINTQVFGNTENLMLGGSDSPVTGYETDGFSARGDYFGAHMPWRTWFSCYNPSTLAGQPECGDFGTGPNNTQMTSGDTRPNCLYYAPDGAGEIWQNNTVGSTLQCPQSSGPCLSTWPYSTGPTWQCNSSGVWQSLGTETLYTGYGNAAVQCCNSSGGNHKDRFEIKDGWGILLEGNYFANGWEATQHELVMLPQSPGNGSVANGYNGHDQFTRGTQNAVVQFSVLRDGFGAISSGAGLCSPNTDPVAGIIYRNLLFDNAADPLRTSYLQSTYSSDIAPYLVSTPNFTTCSGVTGPAALEGGNLFRHITSVNATTALGIEFTTAKPFAAIVPQGLLAGHLWLDSVTDFGNGYPSAIIGGITGDCGVHVDGAYNPVYGAGSGCGTVDVWSPGTALQHSVFPLGANPGGSYVTPYTAGTGYISGTFVPTLMSTVLVAPGPASWSGTAWVYPNLAVNASGTGCGGSACSGIADDYFPDPGADMGTTLGLSEHAIDGGYNANLNFTQPWTYPASSTSAIALWQSPLATGSCTVVTSLNENLSSPSGSHSYSGAHPNWIDTITGLTSHSWYWGAVQCPSADGGGVVLTRPFHFQT